jgi:hypothetical protein
LWLNALVYFAIRGDFTADTDIIPRPAVAGVVAATTINIVVALATTGPVIAVIGVDIVAVIIPEDIVITPAGGNPIVARATVYGLVAAVVAVNGIIPLIT